MVRVIYDYINLITWLEFVILCVLYYSINTSINVMFEGQTDMVGKAFDLYLVCLEIKPNHKLPLFP